MTARAEAGGDAPAGYDVIIDIVAGPDLPSFFARLNPNGRMVAVGAVAGDPPADFGMRMFAAFQKSMSFATFSANTVPEADRRAATAELFAAAAAASCSSVVHELLPLEQAALAHQKMDAGEVFGRIVLTPRGDRPDGSQRDEQLLSVTRGPVTVVRYAIPRPVMLRAMGGSLTSDAEVYDRSGWVSSSSA